MPQTQIVINATSDGPDGQPINTQRILTIFILQNSHEVQEQIKMASEMSERGEFDPALRMLSSLCEQQKISMQETQATQQNVSDPSQLTHAHLPNLM